MVVHLGSQHTYSKTGDRETRIRQKLKAQLVWNVLYSGRKKRPCHKTVEDRELAHTHRQAHRPRHTWWGRAGEQAEGPLGKQRRGGTLRTHKQHSCLAWEIPGLNL